MKHTLLRTALPLTAVALIAIMVAHADTPPNPHKTLTFDCVKCHSAASFTDIRFDHNLTGYQLGANHAKAKCLGCHTVDNFSRAKADCVSCHEDIHEARMGSDCERCHSSNGGWTVLDVQAIHLETNFPVVGRHALLDCQNCHPGFPKEDLSFNTTRCVDCHQQNYLDVSSPNHVSGGLSTECQDCHQMNTWRPAQFADHDPFFPIYSGAHRGQWNQCATCHINPANNAEFSCLNCHGHPQGDTDNKHQGISGYAYNSQDCYTCHPTGEGGSFADHDAQSFPIYSGKHANSWDNCTQCHQNSSSRKVFTCLTCHRHTQVATDNAHQGISGYSYVSQECYSCHPTGERGSFVDHDAELFPIFSAKHRNKWDECADCHTQPQSRTFFTCTEGCHKHRVSRMNAKHRGRTGYAPDGPSCIGCHPRGRS